jgi:hypothetical protein
LGSSRSCINLTRRGSGDGWIKNTKPSRKGETLVDTNLLGIQNHSRKGLSFVLEKGPFARFLKASQLRPETRWEAEAGEKLKRAKLGRDRLLM